MYGERLALKSRLDELNHAEERIIRQYQEERERIYARLRKLDEEERFLTNPVNNEIAVTKEEETNEQQPNVQELIEQTQTALREEYALLLKDLSTKLTEATKVIDTLSKASKQIESNGKVKGRNKREYRKNQSEEYASLYEEALSYLKRQTASVQSVDIKKEVEDKTGMEIKNMTNFMTRLMKKYPNIQKPYRGQYIYLDDTAEDIQEEQQELITNTY